MLEAVVRFHHGLLRSLVMKSIAYFGKKIAECLLLGVLFYMPFNREPTMNGLMWSICCSVIVCFSIDYLCK